VCARLAWLGLRIDSGLNDEADVAKTATPLALVSAKDSPVRVWVAAADENRVAAEQALACLQSLSSPAH